MTIPPPVRLLVAFGLGFLLAAAPIEGHGDDSFRSAKSCSRCHPEIYRTWRSSRHAAANTGVLYRTSLDRIRREGTGRDSDCGFCHDPLRFFLAPDDPVADILGQEGVTCDFCHSVEFLIQGIQGSGFPRYLVDPGVTFGPYPPTEKSTGETHKTKFSGMQILSVFCAGCHEYRNEHGVSVLSTYGEWEESFYRGNSVHCQFCHLPGLFDAPFLDPERKKGPIGHEMEGAHSPGFLEKALPVRATLTKRGKEARVTVFVKNDFVGHDAPSGFPANRLRLETTVYDEDRRLIGKGSEIFERVLGDGKGNPLRAPERFFTEAREVLKDTRIAPKEVRRIVQRFPLAVKAPATAEIALLYETFLPGLPRGPEFPPTVIRRMVVPLDTGPSWGLVAVIVLAGASLLLAAVLVVRRYRS